MKRLLAIAAFLMFAFTAWAQGPALDASTLGTATAAPVSENGPIATPSAHRHHRHRHHRHNHR